MWKRDRVKSHCRKPVGGESKFIDNSRIMISKGDLLLVFRRKIRDGFLLFNDGLNVNFSGKEKNG